MKRLFLPIAAIVILASCASKNDKLESNRQIVLTDTVNLQPGVANGDTAVVSTPAPAPVAPQIIYIDRTPATTKRVAPQRTKARAANPVAEVPTTTVPAPTGTGTGTTANVPAPQTPEVVPVENKKKGISDAAKGAAIGGIGGAAAGAVIGKNGKGAVIGGVLGAAGGYILGRKKDRQSGRVDTTRN